MPTDDKKVRTELRSRGYPITLFGERPEDRRDRLRQILYEEQRGGDDDEAMVDATPRGEDENEDEDEDEDDSAREFYIEGSQELLEARREIARYSLPRAAQRIAYQKRESRIPVATHVRHRNAIKEKLSGFELYGSQIASERPVSMVRFAPNGEAVAVGDWAGSIKLLDLPNLETTTTFRGHRGMIGGLAWYPGATLPTSNVSSDSVNLASTCSEGDIKLWSLQHDTPLATLTGHTARVVRCDFHPSGNFLASASYDTTWRLWDMRTHHELLLQEGHSKEVFTVAFSPDGSLLASAGLDSLGPPLGPPHRPHGNAARRPRRTHPRSRLESRRRAPPNRQSRRLRQMLGSPRCTRIRQSGRSPRRRDRSALVPRPRRASLTVSNQTQRRRRRRRNNPKEKAAHSFSHPVSTRPSTSSPPTTGPSARRSQGHAGTVLATDVTADGRWIASSGRDRTVKVWARGRGEGEGL